MGTHTRGDRHSWSPSQPQTNHCLEQHPCAGLTPDTSPNSHASFSSCAGRGRTSLVQDIYHTPQVDKHMHICGSPQHCHGPSAHLAPLPESQPLLPTPKVSDSLAGPAGCSLQTHSTHTLVSQTLHTCKSLQIQA